MIGATLSMALKNSNNGENRERVREGKETDGQDEDREIYKYTGKQTTK